MGFFDFLKGPDINEGVAAYSGTPGAVLLDVRTEEEYRSGHIPGSVLLPLQSLNRVDTVAAGKQTPLFVYCHSGARALQAASYLKHQGYSSVTNIGGIIRYRGKVVISS